MVATTLDIFAFDGAVTFCAVAVLLALIFRFGAAERLSGFASGAGHHDGLRSRGFSSGQLSRKPRESEQVSGDFVLSPNSSEQMPMDEQWDRVSGFLWSALDAGATAQQKHRAASRQLDAVDYALSCLLDELRPLMPQVVRMDGAATVAVAGEPVATDCVDSWQHRSVAA